MVGQQIAGVQSNGTIAEPRIIATYQAAGHYTIPAGSYRVDVGECATDVAASRSVVLNAQTLAR